MGSDVPRPADEMSPWRNAAGLPVKVAVWRTGAASRTWYPFVFYLTCPLRPYIPSQRRRAPHHPALRSRQAPLTPLLGQGLECAVVAPKDGHNPYDASIASAAPKTAGTRAGAEFGAS